MLQQQSRRKLAILANGRAGDGAAVARTFAARSQLWGRECEFHSPKSLAELRTTCQSLSPEDYDALVVIGGDGTVNQVIQSLHEASNPVPLYPFPGGTANDLSRELGVKADWNQVQTLVDRRQIDWIDLIEINGVPFATVAGLGIAAHLTRDFNEKRADSFVLRKLSQLMRFQIYSLLGAKLALFDRSYIHNLSIESSAFNETLKTPAVFLCNQTHLGGNLRVAPAIDNNDRRFNVLVVNTCSRAGLIKAMFEVKAGKLPKDFFVFSTDQLTITDLDQRPILAFGDGEVLTQSDTLDIRVSQKKLAVFRGEKPGHA